MRHQRRPVRGHGQAWAVATIPVRFARELIARLPLQATARQALIARAGIPPGLLDVDGPRVAPPAYRRLNRLAVAAGDDEYLGYLARPVPPGTMAQMLRLLAYLPDLDAAATEAGRVIGLFDGARPWAVEHDRADGRGRIRLLASRGVQADSLLFAHIQLLGLIHVLGWLAGETVPVQRVILPAAFAEHAAESRFLFGRAVEHHPGDSAAIVFGPGALARPVIARPDTAGSFARRLIDRTTTPTAPTTIEAALRHLLAATRPFAGLRETEAAARLGLTRSTLARRLAQHDTTFQAIRDELRRDLACALLRRTELSLADIAERLDYSEPSAFQRAFNQWTGQPPASWRQRHR
jgi:AraC-like DNA-binding protein